MKIIKDACARRPLSSTHSELRVFRQRHQVTHSFLRPNTSPAAVKKSWKQFEELENQAPASGGGKKELTNLLLA